MSGKVLAQVSVLTLLLFALLAIPAAAQAGGMCGGAYVVDAGDTLNSIAAKCGITASAITAANPGVTDPPRTGQTLTLPAGSPSSGSVTSSIVSSDNTYVPPATTNTNSNPNYYAPPVTYSGGTYVVQYGDTFSAIANRFGVSTYELWGVNPQIWDINYLYAGQVIYLPTSGGQVQGAATTQSEPLSYGRVPPGTPMGRVRLVNRTSGTDMYVSLQGTTRDGINVIYEYPVGDSLIVKVPTGDYTYVAWANERKFVGYFHLGKSKDHTLTFLNTSTKSE